MSKKKQAQQERNKARAERRTEAARIAEENRAAAKKTATLQIKNGGKPLLRRKLDVSDKKKPEKKRGAYRISLENISEGNRHINAAYTEKKGIETSVSAHTAFEHKDFEMTIPVIIQKATVPNRRQLSKRLDESAVGEWVRANVPKWKEGIWYSRIGHTNIVSNSPLNPNKDVIGYVLISSKKVEQKHGQKGRMGYYFLHLIITGTEDKIKPAFKLVINDLQGEDIPGEVHIGPTVGALYNGEEVEEYLHLEPCE
ncbi:hypothetical protein KAS31_03735 [Candidatus Parcubacteria bacterium]|nr:hypothetical protein [Candidatus Parcubacteria bacterium]